ncbi:hypothetical protein Tco_0622475 [Tanacetum coccineum]
MKKRRKRKPKRKDTEVPQPSGPTTNVADEAVYEEMDDSRVTGARNHGANTIAQTRSENVSKHSNDLLLVREHKDYSSSGDYKFKTTSQEVREERRVKNSQAQKIIQVGRSAKNGFQQGRKIDDIDKDVEITLVDETQGRYGDEEMFNTCVLDDDKVLAEPEVTTKDVNLSVDEVTLAQALAALKSVKVQEKANVVEELSESITTTPTLTTTTTSTIILVVSTRPKAKGLVIHEEEHATTPIVSSQQPS